MYFALFIVSLVLFVCTFFIPYVKYGLKQMLPSSKEVLNNKGKHFFATEWLIFLSFLTVSISFYFVIFSYFLNAENNIYSKYEQILKDNNITIPIVWESNPSEDYIFCEESKIIKWDTPQNYAIGQNSWNNWTEEAQKRLLCESKHYEISQTTTMWFIEDITYDEILNHVDIFKNNNIDIWVKTNGYYGVSIDKKDYILNIKRDIIDAPIRKADEISQYLVPLYMIMQFLRLIIFATRKSISTITERRDR